MADGWQDTEEEREAGRGREGEQEEAYRERARKQILKGSGNHLKLLAMSPRSNGP